MRRTGDFDVGEFETALNQLIQGDLPLQNGGHEAMDGVVGIELLIVLFIIVLD